MKLLEGIVVIAAACILGYWAYGSVEAGDKVTEYRKLTESEESVIVHKGTEPPFSGKYVKHKADGTYVCKRCGQPLFESKTKFDSGSGWPSFDDAIDGAVRRIPDADGVRVEIVCASCGAHLGHVFVDEGFTPKNMRYCVNSISLDFVPAATGSYDRAIFASGCFWGTEYMFAKAAGVIATTVGYTGGHVANPSYEQVSSGTTGHAEAVEVIFDPEKTTYEKLARLFFETHDPTQKNRQGPDVGHQYRSAIFYLNEAQKRIALALVVALEKLGYDVVTEIVPATHFWPAEDYHQDYYQNRGGRPYCHAYTKRFKD